MKSELKINLGSSKNEADIRYAWINEIRQGLKNQKIETLVDSRVRSDGYIYSLDNSIRILIESKQKIELTKDTVNVVLIQALYYVKELLNKKAELPTCIFICDKNKCFVYSISIFSKYLQREIKGPASSAGINNPDLRKEMLDDENISIFPFILDNYLDENSIIEKIVDVSSKYNYKVKITPENILYPFRYFIKFVLQEHIQKKLSAEDKVSIFTDLITNYGRGNYHLNPNNNNILRVNGHGDLAINGTLAKGFFNQYSSEYTAEEVDKLNATSDRLIEEVSRRHKGEFYTPTEWVNEAHGMIENALGKDWKEKYVVWDPAWGTGNLTRDYKFKELYCSTLNNCDILTGAKYNNEAVKFQYDFLNDDVDMLEEGFDDSLFDDYVNWKLPLGLLKAFKENKKILIVINPPYSAANNMKIKKEGKNTGSVSSKVQEIMRKKLGGTMSKQLYIQFLYRIIKMKEFFKLDNLVLAMFSPTNHFENISFLKIQDRLFKHFKIETGMFFNAGHFSDTSSAWGISFVIYNSSNENKKKCVLQIKDKNKETDEIEIIGTKNFIRSNKEGLKFWLKRRSVYESKEKEKGFAIEINTSKSIPWPSKRLKKNFLGGHAYGGSDLLYYKIYTKIVTNDNRNTPITPQNFMDCIASASARWLTKETWINYKAELLGPNTNHPDYDQWNRDCIIYSLTNYQASFRGIEHEDKKYDIKNEFFWMPINEIQEITNKTNHQIYRDTIDDHERFVYKKLQEIKDTLSPDALEILEMMNDLTRKSFTYRTENFCNDYPNYYLQAWDAGWYQIKFVLEKFLPNELKTFYIKFKDFSERLSEESKKFGFLEE